MTLRTIPQIQAEAELLYAEWRIGNLSRFQLQAGSYALAGMVKMIRDDFEMSVQRVKLNMDGNNQRKSGGALLVPTGITLEEFQKHHTTGKDPQTTLTLIRQSDEYKEAVVERTAISQAESEAKANFFLKEIEDGLDPATPNLIEELEKRYADQT